VIYFYPSTFSLTIATNFSISSFFNPKRKSSSERNQAFIDNPKRAGGKIWGEDIVEPIFKESNNCKDPNWR
jgi:hypothetical protein